MKKFLFLIVVPVLMVSRLAAQTVDTVNLDQHDVPTVILMDSDFEESSTSVNDASTLLNSSRDVFNSIAAYNFGSLRYRVRGNDSKYSEVMINGISMNDPETGRPVFSNWGGLNDAFRNSVLVEGLGKTGAGFGGLGGLTAYNTRASQYRKQIPQADLAELRLQQPFLPSPRHGLHRHGRAGEGLVHHGQCQLALCGNPRLCRL